MCRCVLLLQGKAWQFKDFPFKGADKGDVRETFSQLFGAYFYYSDEKVNHMVQM
jgi:parafibromin